MDKIKYNVCRLDQSGFTFICPSCGYQKQLNRLELQKLYKYQKVKIKCKCGDIQHYVFEKRHQSRKASKLKGVIYHTDKNGCLNFVDIKITDISTAGMCFEAAGDENASPAPGNKILIKFKANEMASSIITKEAAIRGIRDNFFHVEFCENSKSPNDLRYKILLYS